LTNKKKEEEKLKIGHKELDTEKILILSEKNRLDDLEKNLEEKLRKNITDVQRFNNEKIRLEKREQLISEQKSQLLAEKKSMEIAQEKIEEKQKNCQDESKKIEKEFTQLKLIREKLSEKESEIVKDRNEFIKLKEKIVLELGRKDRNYKQKKIYLVKQKMKKMKHKEK